MFLATNRKDFYLKDADFLLKSNPGQMEKQGP